MATELAKCGYCGREIETCACCDEPDCPDPTCYRDVLLVVNAPVRYPPAAER